MDNIGQTRSRGVRGDGLSREALVRTDQSGDVTSARSLQELWDGQSTKYLDRPATLQDWPFDPCFLPRKNDRILDAGCGAGTYLGMVRALCHERYGIDIGPRMVEAASRFGQCVVGDVRALPYPSEFFDYILSVLVISHCGDSTKALSEMARVCRPGGSLVLALPNRNCGIALLRQFAIMAGTYSLGVCEHFTFSKVETLGRRYGLEVVQRQIINRKPDCATWVRQAAATVMYRADRVASRLLPWWWGETLVVRLEKKCSA